ncbi:MAG: geranylgeranyl reductase [Candidatus Cloacimonetes bacterium HGW-Cloacimonetes-3]|jgi:geranylgeranyl reductase family protein|nr:MAG: geranylgeranyl reductase [Candidatus Cloacimonetes bacterium HGW-Cloacimonetes-3]
MAVYDVAVVGAGPAGSAAARTCALAGFSTCIIDKSHFPRQKLCGGLLTLRAKKIYDRVFERKLEEVILHESHSAELLSGDSAVLKLSHAAPICFTDRILFDEFLLKQAVQAGAHAITGVAVKHVDTKANTLVLSDGTQIQYKYLIGCDGVHSTIAHALWGQPLNLKHAALGLELDVPLTDTNYSPDNPQVFFGKVNWGYGWIFPKGDKLCLGMAALPHKNSDLRKCFHDFLLNHIGYIPKNKTQGHWLPYCDFKRHAGKGNVMLCGDAAGLVDPITGEGIAYAIHSGYLAAMAITASFGDAKAAQAAYRKEYKRIVSKLKITAKLSLLIYSKLSRKLFLRALPHSERFGKLHLDLMADNISYPAYKREILKELGLLITRKLTRNKRLFK